jgi:hypothetical protein
MPAPRADTCGSVMVVMGEFLKKQCYAGDGTCLGPAMSDSSYDHARPWSRGVSVRQWSYV